MIGGIEKEISPELAEALLNTEGLRLQICKARDHSFADVFGVLDKNLKHSRELKFIDFRPSDDVSAGDMLLGEEIKLKIMELDVPLEDTIEVLEAVKIACTNAARSTKETPHP